MPKTIDLSCVPHRCACQLHGGTAFPEGQTHLTADKCPFTLPDSLRFKKRSAPVCCTMRGTSLAIALAQFEADYILEKLGPLLSPKEADEIAGELWNLEERIHEEVLMHLDEEEAANPLVELRVPSTPDHHSEHSWHLQRVPVRKAIEILSDSADWYCTVASRGFGVIHEWRTGKDSLTSV